MKANYNMDEAPKDRNILIQTVLKAYHNSEWDSSLPPRYRRPSGWYDNGSQWIEARWREAHGGRPAQFVEWCGNPNTSSTGSLFPVAWAELPE